MFRYRKLRKNILKSRGILGVNYKDNQTFLVSKEAYNRVILHRVISSVIILIFIILLAVNHSSEVSNGHYEKPLIIIVLAITMVLIGLEGYWRYKKRYPKCYITYADGIMTYCDGRSTHTIHIKKVFSVSFHYYPRSEKWRLRVTAKYNYETFYMDIEPFERPEVIFALLTNFSKGIKVYK